MSLSRWKPILPAAVLQHVRRFIGCANGKAGRMPALPATACPQPIVRERNGNTLKRELQQESAGVGVQASACLRLRGGSRPPGAISFRSPATARPRFIDRANRPGGRGKRKGESAEKARSRSRRRETAESASGSKRIETRAARQGRLALPTPASFDRTISFNHENAPGGRVPPRKRATRDRANTGDDEMKMKVGQASCLSHHSSMDRRDAYPTLLITPAHFHAVAALALLIVGNCDPRTP